MSLDQIIDTETFPIEDRQFRQQCKATLDQNGALVLPGFLREGAIDDIGQEGEAKKHLAYFCTQNHNVYLLPSDPEFAVSHPRNREVVSSKGCITDDLIAPESPLRRLYDSSVFKEFLCHVLGEQGLYPYADPLSSINLHYAETGQELGWHFDNSSFAITLMIRPPESGGQFEYVRDLRNAEQDNWNYEGVADLLNGKSKPDILQADAGTLSLFRGRNSIHRVAPNMGKPDRMLVVLAYNSEPSISLDEGVRETFYGRVS